MSASSAKIRDIWRASNREIAPEFLDIETPFLRIIEKELTYVMTCVLKVSLLVVTVRLIFFLSFRVSTLFQRGWEGAILLNSLTGLITLT